MSESDPSLTTDQAANGKHPTFLPLHRSVNSLRWSKDLDTHFEEALSALIQKKTPKSVIYQRPGRGKSTFDYVPGWWIVDQLNALFGFNWDWDILHEQVGQKQVWVRGKLTVRTVALDGEIQSASKTAYGGSDIKTARDGGSIIDLADDLKSAATDALKKAASLFGIAADIYGGEDEGQADGKPAIPEPTLRALYMRGGQLGWAEEQVQKWCEEEEGGIPFESIHPSKMNTLLGKLAQKAREKSLT